MSTRSKGAAAETIAAEYLIEKGYQILARNYHAQISEIDIICMDKQEIVFVEVKATYADSGVHIMETLSDLKVASLEGAINRWLLENDKLLSQWRLDFIGIELSDSDTPINIEHIISVDL